MRMLADHPGRYRTGKPRICINARKVRRVCGQVHMELHYCGTVERGFNHRVDKWHFFLTMGIFDAESSLSGGIRGYLHKLILGR